MAPGRTIETTDDGKANLRHAAVRRTETQEPIVEAIKRAHPTPGTKAHCLLADGCWPEALDTIAKLGTCPVRGKAPAQKLSPILQVEGLGTNREAFEYGGEGVRLNFGAAMGGGPFDHAERRRSFRSLLEYGA